MRRVSFSLKRSHVIVGEKKAFKNDLFARKGLWRIDIGA